MAVAGYLMLSGLSAAGTSNSVLGEIAINISSAAAASANTDAITQRKNAQGASSSAAAAQPGTGSTSATNIVSSAQAQSQLVAESLAQMKVENAASFSALESRGITVKVFSFAQIYQAQVADAVDTNGGGTISQTALDRQVVAGGGTQAQANALYKAMDENGDGTVSKQEFADSIPVPANIGLQMLGSAGFGRNVPAPGQGAPASNSAQTQAPSASQILAYLAAEVSGSS
jgi:hypothetical protein